MTPVPLVAKTRPAITRVLTPAELRAARLLIRAYRAALGRSSLDALIDLVGSATGARDPLQALNQVQWGQIAATLRDPMTRLLGEQAQNALTTGLPASLRVATGFTDTDPRAVLYAQTQVGDLIRAINEEQRAIVRDTIARSVAGEYTVPQAARVIRRHIGLTPRAQASVDRGWQRAYDKGIERGWTDARASRDADRQATAHQDRLIQSRASSIARTEILGAQNAGRYVSWQQAIEQGYASPLSRKKWITAPERSRRGKPCDICAPMNGQVVQWNTAFPNGVVMPPAHPSCRCTAVLLPADD